MAAVDMKAFRSNISNASNINGRRTKKEDLLNNANFISFTENKSMN